MVLNYNNTIINLFSHIRFSVLCMITCCGGAMLSPLHAQISIQTANGTNLTVENIVRSNFLGNGVRVNSIRTIGSPKSIGAYSGAQGDISLDRGMVLSTGSVQNIAQANNSTSTGDTADDDFVSSDPDLQSLTESDIKEVTGIEIEFVPQSEELEFRYVFASEEYPEFTCSKFNDLFAFFVSGADPYGGSYDRVNIALVPDPSDPTGNTFTDFPVWTNSVNSGDVGELTSGDTCDDEFESLGFSQYYNDNTGSETFTFDGFLDVFKAKIKVVPCESYTIKLIIGDNNDFDYDSAVFLEANSLKTRDYRYYVRGAIGDEIQEGCDRGVIGVEFDQAVAQETVVPIPSLGGTAREGEDYSISGTVFTVPAGGRNAELDIIAIEDANTEQAESLFFIDNQDGCSIDTLRLSITDNQLKEIFDPLLDLSICRGEELMLMLPESEETTADYSSAFSISAIGEPAGGTTTIDVTVDETGVFFDGFFLDLCLDGISHDDLSELSVTLRSPTGESAAIWRQGELSGSAFGDVLCVEGDPSVRSRLSDYYATSSVSGAWSIVIIDHVPNSNRGTIDRVSISTLNRAAVEYSITDQNGQLVDFDREFTESMSYTISAQNGFGCSYEMDGMLTLVDDLQAPDNLSCTEIDRDQLLFSWTHTDPNTEFEINIDGDWVLIGNVFEYLVTELPPDMTVGFAVRAAAGTCSSAEAELFCGTPPCEEPNFIIDLRRNNTDACSPNGLINVSSNSTKGPYSYEINGEESASGEFTGLGEGRYEISITDGYGCSVTEAVVITGEMAMTVISDKVDAYCGVQGFIDLFVRGGTPPYTYEWSNGSDEESANGLDPGIYSVIVRDQGACMLMDTFEILSAATLEIENIVASPVSCFQEQDGSISYEVITDGISYQEYLISQTGDTLRDFTMLRAGQYRLLIIDENGCDYSEMISVTEPEELRVSENVQNASCSFQPDGTIALDIIGGVAPYTISWSSGQRTDEIDGLPAGSYEVTVTDDRGCRVMSTIVVDAEEVPTYSFSVEHPDCSGEDDGVITFITTDDLTLTWNDDQINGTRRSLSAGEYCGTIISASGCQLDTCIQIIEPLAMTAAIATTDNTCFGIDDGSVSISMSNGTAPYSYLIDGPIRQTGESGEFVVLPHGEYDITVTDAMGCTFRDAFTIRRAEEVLITAQVDPVSCSGDASGNIDLSISGLDGALNFSWTDSGGEPLFSGEDLFGQFAGVYNVMVIDEDQCEFTASFSIDEPEDLLTAEVISTDVICHYDNNGSITIDAAGGVGSYQVSISDGQGSWSGSQHVGLDEGIYTASVVDDAGCELVIDSIVINRPDTFRLDMDVDTTAYEFQDVDLPLTVIGAQGEYDLFWTSDPDGILPCTSCDSTTIVAIENTTVVAVEAIDDAGCVAYDEKKIFIQRANHVSIPTAFTPNGDNQNDRLFVYGTPGAIVQVFSVYNRTGVRLYYDSNIEVNQENKGWDGTFKGKQVSTGAYVWTAVAIFADGRSGTFSGTVQLIR